MAIKLTPRQQEILDLIRSQIARTGFPPTRAEIAQELGFKSANAAEDHLKALAKKGAIELTAGASRGIRLTASPPGNPTSSHNTTTTARIFNTLVLPVVGRVAAGSPILASEHVERELSVEPTLFTATPHYLLK